MKLDGVFFKRTDDESAAPELFTAKEINASTTHVFTADGALLQGMRPAKFKDQFVRAKAEEVRASEPPAPIAPPPASGHGAVSGTSVGVAKGEATK